MEDLTSLRGLAADAAERLRQAARRAAAREEEQ